MHVMVVYYDFLNMSINLGPERNGPENKSTNTDCLMLKQVWEGNIAVGQMEDNSAYFVCGEKYTVAHNVERTYHFATVCGIHSWLW